MDITTQRLVEAGFTFKNPSAEETDHQLDVRVHGKRDLLRGFGLHDPLPEVETPEQALVEAHRQHRLRNAVLLLDETGAKLRESAASADSRLVRLDGDGWNV